jgi:hypothetical protein
VRFKRQQLIHFWMCAKVTKEFRRAADQFQAFPKIDRSIAGGLLIDLIASFTSASVSSASGAVRPRIARL